MPPITPCHRRMVRAFLALVLISAGVSSALAESATTAARTQPKPKRAAHAAAHATRTAKPAPPATAPARAGMIEGDPSEVAPIPSAAEPLRAGPVPDVALDRSTRGLMLIRRSDGSSSVNLQGRFRNYTVFTIAADGSSRISCVEDAAAAIEMVRRAGASTFPAVGSEGRLGGPRCGPGPRED